MKISIIGTGYVGLATGISLANNMNHIICVGRNREKIKKINNGNLPFFEPGLDKLLQKVLKKKTFTVSSNLQNSILQTDITFIAVGTPTINNHIDLSEIKNAACEIGKALKRKKSYHVIVVKSTVVPTTTESVIKPIIEKYSGKKADEFGLCMNPEFLREGNAIEDAINPDRIVIGQIDDKSGKYLARAFKNFSCPIIFTNLRTAEMIKYTSNSLFATIISFSNEISRICEKIGEIDVVDVWKTVHLDKRLSPGLSHYLFSGCGYGGSCFPKDTKALLSFAKKLGLKAEIIKSVVKVNTTQPERLLHLLKKRIAHLKNKKIAILGLSFKPDTDDLRESPALTIIKLLMKEKAQIICHDPMVYKNSQRLELNNFRIRLATTVEEAVKGADAVLLLTAWNEYKSLKPIFFKKKMKKPLIIDGRRIYSKELFINSGVEYLGIGYTS